MLDHFVSSRNLGWLRNSVLNSVIDIYIQYLIHYGYSEHSIRTQTHSVAHFAFWLQKHNIPLNRINEYLIDQFLFVHLPVCNCSKRCVRSLVHVRTALRHLLKSLRAEEKIPPLSTFTIRSPIDEELDLYETYLQDVCGLTYKTRVNRVYYARLFLLHQFGRHPIIMKNINSGDILRYVTESSRGFKPATAQVINSALRNYLRYRSFVGDYTKLLIAAVPSVAQWRLATVPRALPPSDVKRVLNAFDRTTPIGKRDYAMARSLIDLGLRAGEVAHLQIDDVNWHAGTLKIQGTKGHRIQLLPLPSQTGEAIVDYLRWGRPTTQSRALFIRHRGGVNCPVGAGTVCSRIRLASVRCNISPPIGANVCRHTAACSMLKAGASLKDIADILGHRRLDTTMIYAKIDFTRLALVVAPWPRRTS